MDKTLTYYDKNAEDFIDRTVKVDFTSESFGEFLMQFPELHIIAEWISGDVRPGRGEEKWLNIILEKSTIR